MPFYVYWRILWSMWVVSNQSLENTKLDKTQIVHFSKCIPLKIDNDI